MIDQGMGKQSGTGISFDDLPTGSIVYVGRGSFRMQASSLDALEREQGIVQSVSRVATAPYGDDGPASGQSSGLDALDRAPSSSSWRAPDLRSLFGSQVDVPLLAAPTGALRPRGRVVMLSRATLAGVGAMIFVCGVLAAGMAWHRRPAPTARATAARPTSSPVPAPVQAAPPARPASEPHVAVPANVDIVDVPAPRTIFAPDKPAARRPRVVANREGPARTKRARTPWVDPFAE